MIQWSLTKIKRGLITSALIGLLCVLFAAAAVLSSPALSSYLLLGRKEAMSVDNSLAMSLDQRIVTASMSNDPKVVTEALRAWLKTFDERSQALAPFQPSRELVQVALNELTTGGDSSSESSVAAVRQHLRFVPRIGAVVDAHEESKSALRMAIGINSAAYYQTHYRNR